MENGRGENDEVSRRVWEAVETSTGEVGVGEAKGRRVDYGGGRIVEVYDNMDNLKGEENLESLD